MTSEPTQAFVWVWLPGASEPIVAGRLDLAGTALLFTYGRSYLDRGEAIPLYLPELPLGDEPIIPRHEVHGAIADSAPDSWGRRVILNKRVGAGALDTTDLGLLTYLLDSGSDRIGALEFQESPTEYVARLAGSATLAELAQSAQRVEDGVPLSEVLDAALLRGSSIGGARPKALLNDGDRRLIAKFSSSTDPHPVVQAEFVAMRLAALAGLDVARVEITEALDKRILLVERFDRPADGRRAMVSALTMLGLGEHEARYASYADLADVIRGRFTDPDRTLRELFSRIIFNILVSNNDDHARNHAAFWDGEALSLTPAYDICPQARAGGETRQVMAIGSDGWRMSQLAGCLERSDTYHLSIAQAREIADRQIAVITDHLDDLGEEAGLTRVQRDGLSHRQFLNPYATEGY